MYEAVIIITVMVIWGLSMIFMNEMSRSGILFGVKLNEKAKNLNEIKILKSGYKRDQVLALFIFIFLYIVIFTSFEKIVAEKETLKVIVIITGMILYFIFSIAVFIRYNRILKAFLKDVGCDQPSENIVKLDLDLSKRKAVYGRKGIYIYILSFIIIVGTALFNEIYFRKFGTELIRHIGQTGELSMMENTRLTVIMPQIISAFMFFTIIAVNYIMVNIRQKNSLKHGKQSVKNYKRSRSELTFGMSLMTLFSVIFISALDYIMKFRLEKEVFIINVMTFIYLVLISAVVIYMSFGIGNIGDKHNREIDDYYEESEKYWHLAGNIYCNRKDPAVFVSKRVGFGVTLNYGNPKAWYITAAFLILIAAFTVFIMHMS